MTLEILGAGFGRTGTHSLKTALEMLGHGPCHHMYEVRQIPEQVDWWHDIADGATPDWDRVFAGFRSQVDWPASAYWPQLVQHFPHAKVILTDRDPEGWYASISRTILPATLIGRVEDPDPVNRRASDLIYKIALEGIFEGRLADKDFAVSKLMENRRAVIDAVPPERLLVFDTAMGWAPLCAFLGVDVPDAPFPQTNSVAEFRQRKPYLGDR